MLWPRIALSTLTAAATMSRGSKRGLPTTMSAATDFIEDINTQYEKLHKAFEYQVRTKHAAAACIHRTKHAAAACIHRSQHAAAACI